MSHGPHDTLREPDDETTLDELREQAPTYDRAPPTMEMRPVPFHPMASRQPTAKGMPAVSLDPKITEKPGVAIVPPVIVGGAPQDLAGPTEPDGYALTSSWEGPTDPDLGASPWLDAAPTDVSPPPRKPTPAVPAPGAPTIEVSQSLELEAAHAAEREAKARAAAPKVRRRHPPQAGPGPHAPTQVLPSLKKKAKREGSDWPLVLGLLALGLLIAGLLGAVAYGVVRSMRSPAPTPSASAPATDPPAR